jgi:hypothetical protein
MNLRLALLALIVLPVAAAGAQTIPAPKVMSDDTWTYQVTEEGPPQGEGRQARMEFSVVRVDAGRIALSIRLVGSDMPPTEQLVGDDWSRIRSINGHQTVVNRPFDFPLLIGKSWKIDFVENRPDRLHSSVHWEVTYHVVGWEDVTVPAATFHALKIEADGSWQAPPAPAEETHPAMPAIVGGRAYKVFWYEPKVKRWVKSIESTYSSNGTPIMQHKSELVSYRVK